MKNIINTIIHKIPELHKADFNKEILKDNYRRLGIVTIVLFFSELIMYFFSKRLFDTGHLILFFIIGDLIAIPVFWFMNRRLDKTHIYVLKAVQFLYSLYVLAFGIGLTFATQHTADLVHTYFMMVFGVSSILYLKAAEGMVLQLISMSAFLVLLPIYQPDQAIVFVIRANSIIVNLIAWLLARMVMLNRVQLFLDKLTIESKNKELAELVMRDSMTRLYNHEAALSLLQEEINLSHGKKPLSIMLSDIDDFKSINDAYGHLTGDDVVKTVAKTMTEVLRTSDHVCRYGGDEFLVIMPYTDLKSAFNCAERINDAMKNVTYSLDIHPTISGGICQYNSETITEFILKADRKLYEAKQRGKNRFL